MQINPINNYSKQSLNQTKSNFRARFFKAQLEEMTNIRSRSGKLKNMEEFIPRLYTLLERLDEICPNEYAKIEKVDLDRYCIKRKNGVDLITIGGLRLYDAPYDIKNTEVNLLERALVSDEKGIYKNVGCIDIMYMPINIYKAKCWENRNKTKEDIIKDFSIEKQG